MSRTFRTPSDYCEIIVDIEFVMDGYISDGNDAYAVVYVGDEKVFSTHVENDEYRGECSRHVGKQSISFKQLLDEDEFILTIGLESRDCFSIGIGFSNLFITTQCSIQCDSTVYPPQGVTYNALDGSEISLNCEETNFENLSDWEKCKCVRSVPEEDNFCQINQDIPPIPYLMEFCGDLCEGDVFK